MTSPLVTVYIPYASHHSFLVPHAIASANRQTVACEVVSGQSDGTPSRFRNQAANAQTPFVTFLDADDLLEPTFTEDCLRAYQTGKYVYTSWWCGWVYRKPNLCVDGQTDYRSHLVTTLYPTAIFKALGGFDEALPGHEDVDFYLRSARAGICGLHLDKPLLHYTEHGQRSLIFGQRTDKKAIMDDVYLRNGGHGTIMACCGQAGQPAQVNPGAELPGDVKAQALWSGMRSEVGMITGRVYVGGNGTTLNVDPRDVEQAPHLFKTVQDLSRLAPKRETVLREAGLV
jgi:hypothetical protein